MVHVLLSQIGQFGMLKLQQHKLTRKLIESECKKHGYYIIALLEALVATVSYFAIG